MLWAVETEYVQPIKQHRLMFHEYKKIYDFR